MCGTGGEEGGDAPYLYSSVWHALHTLRVFPQYIQFETWLGCSGASARSLASLGRAIVKGALETDWRLFFFERRCTLSRANKISRERGVATYCQLCARKRGAVMQLQQTWAAPQLLGRVSETLSDAR